MNDRLMIAAMLAPEVFRCADANGNQAVTRDDCVAEALLRADALLAAAGEKEDPATHEDCVSVAVHNAVMDRLQVDFDVLKARAEAAESKLVAVESFAPTAANINALPENLKRFVMELEALCDPSGIVAENTIARDTCRALESKLAACEMERDRSQSFAEGLQAELTEAIDARNLADKMVEAQADTIRRLKSNLDVQERQMADFSRRSAAPACA